ncbi:13002_t:CDS:1, partial [Gigaspora margarita]
YSSPTIHKAIENTRDFSEPHFSVPPFEVKNAIVNNKIVETANLDFFEFKAFPIGKLSMVSQSGFQTTCTASVINTEDGNIGLTAGRCLIDSNFQDYENMTFSPGFNNGTDGVLGKFPVIGYVLPKAYKESRNKLFNWGLIKFDNSSLNSSQPLQYFTGALGYDFEVVNSTNTTVQGYPNGGQFPNCMNIGYELCTWEGVSTLIPGNFTTIPIYVGDDGGYGAPYMTNFNGSLGTLYSNCGNYDGVNTFGPIYNGIEFQALLDEIMAPTFMH